MMTLFSNLKLSIEKHNDRNAFYINEHFYTYGNLAQSISNIRKLIKSNFHNTPIKNVGIVANDDLETYASIVALWMEGFAYVPLNPDMPVDRNENIIKQAELLLILDSSDTITFPDFNSLSTKKLSNVEINIEPKAVESTELAYILFTSGTTGNPKGVPITRANLSAFVDAFINEDISITNDDRCLQMFELTFDLSIMSYLIPMLNGACIYTIPKDKIKYSYIFELLDEHDLTFALMVPSILHYLRPYFDEINCPKMKYSLFCGEALPLDVTQEWSKCLPNAKIMNVYGPTEDTIFCTGYTYNREKENKEHHGLLSIGKPMLGTDTIIIDENNNLLQVGETGELCLGGALLTPGYWNNEEKNREAFFIKEINGSQKRFYKTGDLCYTDKEGDMMYIGRADFQVKVQGFRIELSEIEFFCKAHLQKINAVAVAYTNKIGNSEIGLVIESQKFDTADLLNYLQTKVPSYMLPTSILFEKPFPLNVNGKTDRGLLSKRFK